MSSKTRPPPWFRRHARQRRHSVERALRAGAALHGPCEVGWLSLLGSSAVSDHRPGQRRVNCAAEMITHHITRTNAPAVNDISLGGFAAPSAPRCVHWRNACSPSRRRLRRSDLHGTPRRWRSSEARKIKSEAREYCRPDLYGPQRQLNTRIARIDSGRESNAQPPSSRRAPSGSRRRGHATCHDDGRLWCRPRPGLV